MHKTMRTPIIDFHFPLLAPISKRGSGTNDDDGDDEWMFQLYGDAESQEVDILQSGILNDSGEIRVLKTRSQ